MTTFAFPIAQQPSDISFYIGESNAAVFRSPFGDYVQTSDREGERWIVRAAWSFLQGDNRADLLAFMHKLNGMQHRFTMQDFGHAQRGVLNGTPQVNGGSQTGKTLNIDGANNNVTDWAKAGDRISVNNKMYSIDDDANSNGSGQVALTVSPRIYVAHGTSDSIEVTTPVELLILSEGAFNFNTTKNMISTLSFLAMGVPNE